MRSSRSLFAARRRALALALPGLLAGLLAGSPARAEALISVVSGADPQNLSETPGGDTSVAAAQGAQAFSLDGRFLAFVSDAPNLVAPVPFPPERRRQVYVLDRQTGGIELISHVAGQPGVPSAGGAYQPRLSADGRFVAFNSGAGDLVPGLVTVGLAVHVYLYDRQTHTAALVSHVAGLPTQQSGRGALLDGFSADGRFVLFESRGADIVASQVDANSVTDVFLYDRQSGESQLVSHVPGAPATTGNQISNGASISADGAWVAFTSRASDLAGVRDTNGQGDAFLYGRQDGRLRLVSIAHSGAAAANGASQVRGLSADGRRVLFTSTATDLVDGQDLNGSADIFLLDAADGQVRLLSHVDGRPSVTADRGAEEAALSEDGTQVAFTSASTDLVPDFVPTAGNANLYRQDLGTGERRLLSRHAGSVATSADSSCSDPAISAAGEAVLAICLATDLLTDQEDTRSSADAFLFRREDKWPILLSHVHGHPRRSASIPDTVVDAVLARDARLVALSTDGGPLTAQTDANALQDLFVWEGGAFALVSRALADHRALTAQGALSSRSLIVPSGEPKPRQRRRVSADGRFVVFESSAPNLLPGQLDGNNDRDVFLRDRTSGTTQLVSHSAASHTQAANAPSWSAAISADGSTVVFVSLAGDLVAEAAPRRTRFHVYAYDVSTGNVDLLSHAATDEGLPANDDSGDPDVSGDGRWVAFWSGATDLITGLVDANGPLFYDVFLKDRVSGTVRLVSHRADDDLVTGSEDSGSPEVSLDGRVVVFQSTSVDLVSGLTDDNGYSDIFSYDVATGVEALESHAHGDKAHVADAKSAVTALSPDGRFLAFASRATNLVAGQTELEPDSFDVFLRDRVTDSTTLVSHRAGEPTTTAGRCFGSLSLAPDGSLVAYESYAENLVPGQTGGPDILENAFIFDRSTGTNTLVSHLAGASAASVGGSDAQVCGPRYVLFSSTSPQIVAGQVDAPSSRDLFAFDRLSGASALLTHRAGAPLAAGNGSVLGSECALDLGLVVFDSKAADLVPGDLDGLSTAFEVTPVPVE